MLIRESTQEVLSDRPFRIHLFLEPLYGFHIQIAFKITKHVTTLCVQILTMYPTDDCPSHRLTEFDSDNKSKVPAFIVYWSKKLF